MHQIRVCRARRPETISGQYLAQRIRERELTEEEFMKLYEFNKNGINIPKEIRRHKSNQDIRGLRILFFKKMVEDAGVTIIMKEVPGDKDAAKPV